MEKIAAKWSELEKRFMPAYVWNADSLTFWRERILFIICILAAALGPFALVPSLWMAYHEGLWNVILLDSFAYVFFVVIVAGRNWSLKIRAGGVCLIFYALGAFLLFILGPVGAGYIWLFGASVIISAIIGLRAAVWTLLLNAIILLAVAGFLISGHLQWPIQYENALEKWLVMAVNFLLLNAFVTLTTAVMLNGLSQALSAEKETNRSLLESENRFRAISEYSHQGICIVDEQARITWVNNRMLELSGCSREQILGSGSFLDFLAPESTDFVRNNFLIFLKGGDYQHHYHFYIVRADGEIRLFEKYMTDYADKNNHRHLIISMMDVTDQKRAEEEKSRLEARLLQAQKMESIGSLAGGIAHDLNNILFPVSGLSEMLLEEMPPDSPQYRKIVQIHKSALRGSELVKQILAFSRQLNPQKMPIRIQPVLNEVIKLSRTAIPMNIDIRSHINADCGLVSADPTQVHQIAMNLIINAFHAVESAGGSILVELKETVVEKDNIHGYSLQAGKYACISISDTGTGIDQKLINKIFDPYFTTKEQGKGTGLGLSVVHGIVKAHGGDIHVYSEVGRGTRFDVYLPLLEASKDIGVAAGIPRSPTGSERILLVDDEEPIVHMEQMMLERSGYQVAVCTSSSDALAAFKSDPNGFDLVISDRGMPKITGEQLARELIAIRPDIPIIICTGFSDEKDERFARSIGVKGFLMKPVSTAELTAMVRKVLDEASEDTLVNKF